MLYFVLLVVHSFTAFVLSFTTVPPPPSPRILRQNNGDFCLTKRCPIGQRHCMIGLRFTGEQELLPTCMALPLRVYAIEVTENVLFEPTPKGVHLFSRGDNDTMVLYYWEAVTPFGAFDAKYLRTEYPGKLFRVLSGEGIFLVRVPGEDRELSTIATTPTPTTTFLHPTTSAPPTTTIVTSTPVTFPPAPTSSVMTSLTNLTTSNRPSITTTTTTTTTSVDVKRASTSVWTLETITPMAGLAFCLIVLLVLYVRRVWPADWCCCIIHIRRRLERRRINHQTRRNENIELTSLDRQRTSTSSETSTSHSLSSVTSTITTEEACDGGFVNVSLEDD